MNTTFLRKAAVVLVAIFFASCDKDYNTLGSDIVGNDDFTATPKLFLVKAYNQKIPAVQTNNLPVNQLGVMYNDVLGTTKSNFVTQLSLATLKPTFKSHLAIDSVILTVHYFSTKTFEDTNGIGTYTLNSIYTTNTSTTTPKAYHPIDLKVFRSGVYLRDTDPATATTQQHFSDEDSNFNSFIIGSKLNNDSDNKENTAFVPDTKEYKKYKVANNTVVLPKEVESHSSPRMRLHLDKSYFNTNIIQAPSSELDNNNAFKSYFRGLYFQVDESVANQGTSMALDFSKGDVTIYYKQDVIDNDTASTPAQEMASLTLNMSGNTVNLFNNTDNSTYSTAANNPNALTGDKNLYLKGGQGSMAFIELFPGVDGAAQLADLKTKKLLVNEASLTFTVDKTGMTSDYNKPQRIYIFDADNNTPLFDYYLDNTVNSTNTNLNKFIHSGILSEGTSGSKDTYKIRITEHVNRILKETSGVTKNVRLGIVVSGNINIIGMGSLNPVEVPAASSTDINKKMSKSPVSSTISPLGTVIYGSNYLPTDTNYDNRVKFEIYYTEPK